MDNDFEIEILDEEVESAPQGQRPSNYLTFGEIRPDDVQVYIRQDVYRALEEFAVSDTRKELGSILLGDYIQKDDALHVVISNYVEAKYTDASASTLTFTHETWDDIHSQHETRYPDRKIIGWQHTHPNYGIFLSNYDMFIQENFFDLPFQIAYVIDPIQNLRGFFQWKNGKVEKLKGYHVYEDGTKPIKIEQIRVKKEVSAPAGTPVAVRILILLLCLVTAVLSFFVVSLGRNYARLLEQQEALSAQLAAQQGIIQEQSRQLEAQNAALEEQQKKVSVLQQLLVDSILDPTGTDAAGALLGALERGELTVPKQQRVMAQLHAAAGDSEPEPAGPEYIQYTVARGDTLAEICARHGIDYEANIDTILKLNGMGNADLIIAGQTILLPSAK